MRYLHSLFAHPPQLSLPVRTLVSLAACPRVAVYALSLPGGRAVATSPDELSLQCVAVGEDVEAASASRAWAGPLTDLASQGQLVEDLESAWAAAQDESC